LICKKAREKEKYDELSPPSDQQKKIMAEGKQGNESYEQTLQNIPASPLWIPP